MEVTLANTAGFCYGVKAAVDIVLDGVHTGNKRIYTLGPIIHNDQLVKFLSEKGVTVVDALTDIKGNEGLLIISAHGVGKCVYDRIKEINISYTDATCPYVKKIHRLVEKYYNEKYQIVIVGDKNHSEVRGINGWCNDSAVIVNSVEDCAAIDSNNKICVVAQTTINYNLWQSITERIKSVSDVLIHNTICSATTCRQKEAADMARQNDAMLIIGGRHSSNTQKLFEICKNYCYNTFYIETAEDIPPNFKFNKIGITAGASTPAWIIKEVVNKMEENRELETTTTDQNFEEVLNEQPLVTLRTGDIVKGTVIEVTPKEVYVDLGFKYDGIIDAEELSAEPGLRPSDVIKKGEQVNVFVIGVSDGDGKVFLSRKKIESIKGWEAIQESFENETIVDGTVIEVIRGGVIVSVSGNKVFVPASLASDRYVAELDSLVNKKVPLKIIDLDRRKNKIVGSVKVALKERNEALSKEFWENVEIGKIYTGTVKKLMDFGAFVDVGGIDGLIHISQLSWTKIKHPSEVLAEGDVVQVYVISFDKEKGKVSLGYRKNEENPWEIFKTKFSIGDVVNCTVVRLVTFGAFLEIIPGVDGLVHISQISTTRIDKPSSVLNIGDKVDAKIVDVNFDNKKIELSIKELLLAAESNTEGQGDVDNTPLVNAAEQFAQPDDAVDQAVHTVEDNTATTENNTDSTDAISE